MKATLWNIRRALTGATAAALLLTGLGCGQPATMSADLHRKPTGLAQAHEATAEDEPGWKAPKEDLGHFHQVNDTLFRGQQPTDKGLALLKEKGIKTVVYLHFSKKQAAHEKAIVEGLGMNFVHIPMSWITPPKKAQVEQWLKLTNDPKMQPVFVHCQHGRDRTGAMVGIYRINNDGWSFDKAYAEMKQLGFRTILVGLTYGVRSFANAQNEKKAEPAAAMAY